MGFNFSTASDRSLNTQEYFSDRSLDYAQYRPSYPPAALDHILAPFSDPSTLVAADVGAGTGIGARALGDRGVSVLAIEPDAAMRQAATPHDRVTWRAGSAEHIPLDAHSVDLVAVFQAFHWFDFHQSLQEFRRILQPHGRLALVWSLWDATDPATRAYSDIVFAAMRSRSRQSQPPWQWQTLWKSWRFQLFWQGLWLPGFHHLQQLRFPLTQALDQAGLIGLARSQGFTPNTGTGLADLETAIAQFHAQWSHTDGVVPLQYQTRVYSATIQP